MDMLYITDVRPGCVGVSISPDSAEADFRIGARGLGGVLAVLRGARESSAVDDPDGNPGFEVVHVVDPRPGYKIESAAEPPLTIEPADALVLARALEDCCGAVLRSKGAW